MTNPDEPGTMPPSRRRLIRLPRKAPGRGDGVLHHLTAILNLAGERGQDRSSTAYPERPGSFTAPCGAPLRRRRQRLAMAQRLLDPLPAALRPVDQGAEWFWRGMRWGGAGLILAWWLQR